MSYYKWRCLIAFALVDSRLMREEQQFLRDKIENEAPADLKYRLSEEMMEAMMSSEPEKPDEYFSHLSDPEDQVDLLKMAHNLLWVDGDFSELEQSMLDQLLAQIQKSEAAHEALLNAKDSWTDEDLKPLKDYVESRLA